MGIFKTILTLTLAAEGGERGGKREGGEGKGEGGEGEEEKEGGGGGAAAATAVVLASL